MKRITPTDVIYPCCKAEAGMRNFREPALKRVGFKSFYVALKRSPIIRACGAKKISFTVGEKDRFFRRRRSSIHYFSSASTPLVMLMDWAVYREPSKVATMRTSVPTPRRRLSTVLEGVKWIS